MRSPYPLVSLLVVLHLNACDGCSSPLPGNDGARDAPGVHEGLTFQDRAAPADAMDRGTARDRGADGTRLDVRTAPDKAAPDKAAPDAPPVSPCPTDWSKWTCAPSGVGGCAATCGGFVLNCIPAIPLPGMPLACACSKGGQKTCTVSGLLCAVCEAAVQQGCCSF